MFLSQVLPCSSSGRFMLMYKICVPITHQHFLAGTALLLFQKGEALVQGCAIGGMQAFPIRAAYGVTGTDASKCEIVVRLCGIVFHTTLCCWLTYGVSMVLCVRMPARVGSW